MLSIPHKNPRINFHDKFSSLKPQFKHPSAPRYVPDFELEDRFKYDDFTLPSVYRRMRDSIKHIGKNTRRTRNTYILVIKKSPEARPVEGVRSEIRPDPAVNSKDEDLIKESEIDVDSLSTSTVNENTVFNNSLEMNSRLTRDILRSRQSDNQLADLGSINEYLIHKKRIVIDRLMALLEEWLDKNPYFALHAQEGPASSSPGVAPDKGATSAGNHTARGSNRQKRALQSDGIDGSNPSGDEGGEEKRGNKRSRVDGPRVRPFACPFFKNDPSKHKHKGACTGPGWVTMSRLKEHIYRCHWQPHKCIRCYTAFPSPGELENHQRADKPCRKSNAKESGAFITKTQYHLLKKKLPSAKTTKDRWEEVYKIIFPKAENIPSPYYEYDEEGYPRGWDETQGYREFLREEITQGVRNKLDARFDQIEDRLKTEFLDIVQNVVREVIKQNPEANTIPDQAAVNIQQVGPPTNAATQSTTVSNTSATLSEDLSFTDFQDFSFLASANSAEPTPFDYSSHLSPIYQSELDIFNINPEDSAYGSLEGSTGSPLSFKE